MFNVNTTRYVQKQTACLNTMITQTGVQNVSALIVNNAIFFKYIYAISHNEKFIITL
jgi:hypothetical protein